MNAQRRSVATRLAADCSLHYGKERLPLRALVRAIGVQLCESASSKKSLLEVAFGEDGKAGEPAPSDGRSGVVGVQQICVNPRRQRILQETCVPIHKCHNNTARMI